MEEFRYLRILLLNERKIEHRIDRRIGAASAVMRLLYWSVVRMSEAEKKKTFGLLVDLLSHLHQCS